MTQTASISQDAIDHDLPCAGCGYNLRSAPRDGVCSECGLAVLRSVGRNNVLWEARPGWLRSLSWGVWLMLAAQGMLFVISYWGSAIARKLGSQFAVGILGLHVAVIAVYVVGVWLLTRREHTYADFPERGKRLRLTARYATLGMPAIAISAAMPVLGWTGHMQLIQISIFANSFVFILGVFATYLYLRMLAKRVLSRRMAEYALIVAVGMAISLAGYVGIILLTRFVNLEPMQGTIMMIVTIIPILLFYLWSLLVLIMFAVAFAKVSRQAKALWIEGVA